MNKNEDMQLDFMRDFGVYGWKNILYLKKKVWNIFNVLMTH